MGKHLVPDFFQDTLGHHDHDPVHEQGRQDPRQVNHRHDPQHLRQLRKDRVRHLRQRFDEIVDQHAQEQGTGCTADGTDQNQENHQDQPAFIRGKVPEEPLDGSLDVFRAGALHPDISWRSAVGAANVFSAITHREHPPSPGKYRLPGKSGWKPAIPHGSPPHRSVRFPER